MRQFEQAQCGLRLKEMFVEASDVAQLDADRLEALAISCQLLNGALKRESVEYSFSEAHSAVVEMGAFASVLDATKTISRMNQPKSVSRRLPARRRARTRLVVPTRGESAQISSALI